MAVRLHAPRTWTRPAPASARGRCPSCGTAQSEAVPALHKPMNRTVFLCPCGRWYTFAQDGTRS